MYLSINRKLSEAKGGIASDVIGEKSTAEQWHLVKKVRRAGNDGRHVPESPTLAKAS